MGLSYSRYISDGVTTDYVLNFALGYLKRSDVFIFINDVSVTYTWLNDSTVRLDATPLNGDVVLIRRMVKNDELIHYYQDGAIIIDKHLDDSNKQSLMLAHEAQDGFLDSGFNSDMSMNNQQITNVLPGTESGDATTLGQVEDLIDDVIEEVADAHDETIIIADKVSEDADDVADALEEITQLFLGSFASDPATGFIEGSMYYNTTLGRLLVYTGEFWETAGGETNMSVTEVLGMAGSTVVSVAYSKNLVLVSVNGYSLPQSAFTATDNISVLIPNTELGDEIQVLAFDTVTSDNYYSKEQLDGKFLYGTEDPPSAVGLADGTLYFKYKE